MFKKEILKNQIRLITIPKKGTKTVTVLVVVGTGSKYEIKKISGISHFLEHMMFKGTKKRKDTHAISSELDSVGAEYNAFTGNEYTGYYVKADSTHIDLALDMVSDMLINSKLDKKEMQKEKGVVIEEINMYKDNPMRQIDANLESLMYGDQPAGWEIAGTKETVSAFTREEVSNYFKTHYTTKNTIVCIAGNFEVKTIKSRVEKYFNKLRNGENQKKQKVVENQKKPAVFIEYKKTDQTHFILSFRSFINISDKKRYAMSLLANIIGGNMSSRMFINIREKQGLAYYISAGNEATTDTGYFYVRAGVDNKRALSAVKGVLSELKKIKQKGVTKKELKKAKDYMKGKLVMNLEASDDLAFFFGNQEVLKGSLLTLDEIIKSIEKVKISELNSLAKEILLNKNMNLAVIGPFKNEKDFEKALNI